MRFLTKHGRAPVEFNDCTACAGKDVPSVAPITANVLMGKDGSDDS
jgi:hypothetical protein